MAAPLVMLSLDYLHGLLLCHDLLNLTQRLSLCNEVPTKPLANTTDHTLALGLNILDVMQLFCERVVKTNGDDFPMNHVLKAHRQQTQRLYFFDHSLHNGGVADLDDFHRPVVATKLGSWIAGGRVPPGLWQDADVPVNWSVEKGQLPALHHLLYWIPGAGRNTSDGTRVFRYLEDCIEGIREKGDVMPWRDRLAIRGEGKLRHSSRFASFRFHMKLLRMCHDRIAFQHWGQLLEEGIHRGSWTWSLHQSEIFCHREGFAAKNCKLCIRLHWKKPI
mmetsp:Transcript_12515/g.29596  ORF Transcript_12515/g.29596 Transcript_12515/m.29596 type:complete len:276 (-) Transcript_12515:2837-3664(-)